MGVAPLPHCVQVVFVESSGCFGALGPGDARVQGFHVCREEGGGVGEGLRGALQSHEEFRRVGQGVRDLSQQRAG